MGKYRLGVKAFLFRKTNGNIEFALFHKVTSWTGWQAIQGGIEKGETEEQAVLREIKEEAGVKDVKIIGKVPHVVQYDYPPDIKKKMGFDGARQKIYLVKLLSGELKVDGIEHDKCRWVSLEEALKDLEYDDEKEALKAAWKVLKQSTSSSSS